MRGRLFGPAVLVLTVLLLFWSYGGVVNHEFLHWDDRIYIFENPLVTEGGAWNILSGVHFHNWHPLTFLSYRIDYLIWGDWAGGYKLHNLLLHVAVAAMVAHLYALLVAWYQVRVDKQGLRLSSVIVFLAFLLHSQHVETVAWIAERKELLATLFYVLALVFHFRLRTESSRVYWWLTNLAGALALASKPMAVSLPLILVLADLMLFRNSVRPREALGSALPLVLGAGLVSLSALAYQNIVDLQSVGVWERLVGSAYSFDLYLATWLAPLDLTPFYAAPPWAGETGWQSWLALAPPVAVMAYAVLGKPHPLPRFSVAFVLVTLAPVLGVVKFAEFVAADRYTYLPFIPLFMAVGLGVYRLRPASRDARWWVGACAIVAWLLTCTVMTPRYVATWRNDLALWSHAVRIAPDVAATPHRNLGNAYYERGEVDRALAEYKRAIRLAPGELLTYENLAIVAREHGRSSQVLQAYAEMAERNADNPLAQLKAGVGLWQSGQLSSAENHLRRAVELAPAGGAELSMYARFLAATSRLPEAKDASCKAARLAPGDVEILLACGHICELNRDLACAKDAYRRAVMIGNANHARRRLEEIGP